MKVPDLPPAPPAPPTSRKAVAAWCLFDWATNGWPTVVSSFVFAAYITRAVAPNPEVGTLWWGVATAISGIVIAVLSPIFGAMADRGGRRKPWVGAFIAMTIVVSLFLWFIEPRPEHLLLGVFLIALGGTTFEISQVFYNAMLSDVAPRGKVGRVSGWAWAAGYAGGLTCLITALVLFVLPEPPLFGLDPEMEEPTRASAFVVAAWFILFGWPFFVLVPDRPSSGLRFGLAARAGLAQVRESLRTLLPKYRDIAHFLLARMIYTDGLNTLFVFGGIYAAGTFGMGFREILVFGIILNIAAGLGALAFAWVDDWIGPKRTIIISLVCLIVFGTVALLVETVQALYFAASALGIFIGPVQAASRSMMAQISPEHMKTEMFGLYALSGKVTAWAGPFLVGWATYLADSQRVGMATILLFFVVGLLLLLPLKAPARD